MGGAAKKPKNMLTYYMNGPQVGKATSNTFDGDKVLDDGNFILKGIQRQSDIGLLSLFEHYHSIVVGSFLKAPVYPIWLVCAESHFTVLFATQKGTISNRGHSITMLTRRRRRGSIESPRLVM